MTRIIPLMTYAHYKNRFERDVSVCASFQLYFNFFTYKIIVSHLFNCSCGHIVEFRKRQFL